MVSLPPAIQPDGDERQQRKALLADLKRNAEQLHRIHQAAQHLDIEPVQREQLPCQAPPYPATEKVENLIDSIYILVVALLFFAVSCYLDHSGT